MRGHIRQRSPGHWAIVIDVKTDSGQRKRKWHAFKGTKRQAQDECTRLLNELNNGSYIKPSKLTIARHLQNRLAQWEASGRIGGKTAERYRELIDNQIVPHIGDRLVQKLKPADIERWHGTLMTQGRKDGTGGISARTIRHAHRLLSTALKEAARHDLVTKNVAAIERAPKVVDEEVTIIGRLSRSVRACA